MNIRDLTSALMFRSRLANIAGKTFHGMRDLYKALGYKRELFPPDYRSRYRRNAVANRIVKALPKSTWRGGAEIIEDEDSTNETVFEAAWADFEQKHKVWTLFQQADILAGIGRYSIILIGAPGKLEEPLEQCGPDEIAYFTPFAEEDATIEQYEVDVENPRFGLPIYYTVKRTTMSSPTAINSATVGRRVHWTRIQHVADGLLDDKIFGEPRLECVWNDLDNLEKVAGGGAEAFWKRADGGTQFDIDPTLDFDEPSKKAMQDQIEEMEHGLRRYMVTRGLTVNRLGGDVSDFKNPIDSIIGLISAGTGIPQRVLMGSEQGKLAAKMDRSNWDDRVSDRRDDFAGPFIVRPFVNRMIELGVLPAPQDDYDVRWSQLKILDDEQRATIATEWAGLNKASGETVVTPDEIREHVLGLPPLEEVTGVARPDPVAQQPGGPEPVAAAKGGSDWKHVHQVADRFRTSRQTYRERLLQRRAASAQREQAASGPEVSERSGFLPRSERGH